MRFFHLSDLHIGKQLHHYNLREDQEHILGEVISYAETLRPDAVVIAGDVYDKSVPSGEAVSLFDDFLTRMSEIEPAIPVLIIAGNHDSPQRLDYASRLLGSRRIYIAGKAPETEREHLKKITLTDKFGTVHFYLLPFLKPGYVRSLTGGELPQSYTAAVEAVLNREKIDLRERNVLVSHQFYTGTGGMPETCDSELLSVGGIDNVDISVIKSFDYVALGHLHGAQKVGEEHIRYCGTLLKYSVSEAGQEKTLHMVEIGEKGSPVKVEKLKLHPLRDVCRVRGNLADIINNGESVRREDYVSVTLTDETDPYKPKEQLEKVYSRILEVRMDNTRTRKKLEFAEEEIRLDNPLQTFADFYSEMHGRQMSGEEEEILKHTYDKVKGDAQ
nr:exonuclease SbcCD subunit D [uncultured Mediterraneibacter sp.]